jgi:hypothetical protein
VLRWCDVFAFDTAAVVAVLRCPQQTFSYFPKSIVALTTAHSTPQALAVGDLLVLRVSLLPWLHWLPVRTVDAMCADRVVHVYDGEGEAGTGAPRWGFTLATTVRHDEVGEHTAWLVRRPDGLYLEACSASSFWLPWPLSLYARALQVHAHRVAATYIKQSIMTA